MKSVPNTAADSRASSAWRSSAGHAFLRAVEVWSILESGEARLASGIYPSAQTFGELSRGMKFAPGEGLPGWVRSCGLPVVFEDLYQKDFVRREWFGAAGLASGVGLPIFVAGEVAHVVLFLTDSSPEATGVLESWLPDRTRRELVPGAAIYRNVELFERFSRYVRFPYGAGLPGQVWQSMVPVLMDEIHQNPNFVRAAGAAGGTLRTALACPVMVNEGDVRAVVTLLSSCVTPIARVFQVWLPSGATDAIELCQVVAPQQSAARPFRKPQQREPFAGAVGQCWRSRAPVLVESFEGESEEYRIAARECGLSWMLAVPVTVGTETTAVWMLMN